MRAWTVADARRFLDEIDSPPMEDLPLFGGLGGPPIEEDIRVEVADAATLGFWRTLLRRAARRGNVVPEELGECEGLLALGVPDGPALLAVRTRGRGRWRVALASAGGVARRILARIPPADGVGRAA